MMLPTINNRSLFDDFFDGFFDGQEDFFRPVQYKPAQAHKAYGLMKTDIKENEKDFEISIEMPGCKKEDVTAQIKDGYLTISATTNSEKEEKDDEGKYLRRERYSGTMSRRFFVGENMTEEDIQASFEDGILKLNVPKEEPKKVEEPKYITIK